MSYLNIILKTEAGHLYHLFSCSGMFCKPVQCPWDIFSWLCSKLDVNGQLPIPQTNPGYAVWLLLVTLTPWWSSELSSLPARCLLSSQYWQCAALELEGLTSLGKGCPSLCLKYPWRKPTMWMSGKQRWQKMAEHTTRYLTAPCHLPSLSPAAFQFPNSTEGGRGREKEGGHLHFACVTL